MRLTDNEQKIINVYELDADLSYTLGSKRTGLKEGQISYAINRLLERKVIRYYPFIDTSSLGYVHYLIYFTLADSTAKLRQEVLDALINNNSISWLAKFSGDIEYCATILAKSPQEFLSVSEGLFSGQAVVLKTKSIATQTSLTLFQAKYIGRVQNPKNVKWGSAAKQSQLDFIDEKVLSSLMHCEYRSKRELARILKIPSSTLDDRLSSLTARGILVRFVYLLDPIAFGFKSYKVLLNSRSISSKLTKLLFSFCESDPACVVFITCFGSWDYEVSIEVRDQSEAEAFLNRLSQRFSKLLSFVSCLPMEAELKNFCYPFKK